MCGILFAYQPTIPEHELLAHGHRALGAMRHRGPDEDGLIVRDPWLVGHVRLSILDLAASRQPMPDPQERYWLSFNGEIYNFRELRKELATDWNFRTQGDTEVVLAGLCLRGDGFLDRMEGMWALALWDAQERHLRLSRDPMGKKPLYYRAKDEGLIAASELPALKRLTTTSFEEDLDSTADYLRYGYYLPGHTAYREVHEVLPGHILHWQPGGPIQQTAYWQLRVNGFQGSRADAQASLRQGFVQAVEKRMVADVEVGAFLSGGVDSSLIVAALSHLGIHPKTFTIGFAETAYDERAYARRMAAHAGTEHIEAVLSNLEAESLIRLLQDHVGQPFSDSSLLPTAAVSELASSRVKVALSGDGGDELFSGYERYRARTILRWYSRVPKPMRSSIESLIRAFPEPMAHHSRSLLKKAHLFLDILARRDGERPYVAPLLYSPGDFSRLAPTLSARGHAPPALPDECRIDDIQEMMAGDALVYLPQDILVKVDRASMAYSLEARCPFLDKDLVALAFSFPRTWHRSGFQGKKMLKNTFDAWLPAELWRRRKQGFAVPLHVWFRGDLGNHLEGLLSSVQHPFDSSYIATLLQAHRQGRRDHGYRLWNLYVYLLWRQWQGS
ncbi:asparagine synthase (glutamine-hydrolyzing) [Thiocystis violacea]|uniref:asparagine synthase (glutamine-hydrolyzing) n=1 Tax=Thiocystis violacea TaxID=13725 RepID=UPI001906A11C|nr:asparagine synthase (glutamine-hydrolyzing) [Thiocystis violacea]